MLEMARQDEAREAAKQLTPDLSENGEKQV
jgi:hypothetical protein